MLPFLGIIQFKILASIISCVLLFFFFFFLFLLLCVYAGLEAMEAALELEKKVNKSLLDLHKVADSHGDFQVRNVTNSNF